MKSAFAAQGSKCGTEGADGGSAMQTQRISYAKATIPYIIENTNLDL
jgi:hypothetical protein